MKKIALFLALVMVFAMAVPAFANPFSDVSTNHWAYDAIVKVLASGILDGYPDGTFKGDKAVSRYEIAVIVARILDNIAAEREALEAELEAEIDAASADADKKIEAAKVELEEVIKKMAKEGLSDQEAADVALMIRALTAGLKQELKDLGVEVADIEKALGEKIDALEGRVAALEDPVFEWSATAALDFHDIDYTGATTDLYVNPFDMTDADGNPVLFEDLADYFTLSFDLGLNVAKEGFSFDLTLDTVTNNLMTGTTGTNFDVVDFSGSITTPELTATIGNGLTANITDYLFYGAEDGDPAYETISGVVIEGDYGYYVVHGDGTGTYFGGTKTFSLIDQDVDLFVGIHNPAAGVLDDTSWVVGAETTFDLGLFDADVEFATNDKDFNGRLFRLGVSGTVDPIDVAFNYHNIEAFSGIFGSVSDGKGYDLTLSTEYDVVDFSYLYEYDLVADAVSANEFTAEIPAEDADENDIRPEYNGILYYGHFTYDFLNDNYDWHFNAEKDFGIVTAIGDLAYESGPTKVFDKSLDLSADLMEGLTGTASYALDVNNDLTIHEYNLEYTKDIFTVGMDKDMLNTKDLALYATVDPEAIDVAGVEIDSVFNYRVNTTQDLTGYQLVLTGTKAVDSALTLNGGFEYGKNEGVGGFFSDALVGTYKKYTAGLEYSILEDLSATVGYTNVEVTDSSIPYEVEEVAAGLSYDF